MNRPLKALGVFAAASAVVASSLIVFDFFQSRERFPFQTFIGNTSVSNLTKAEAIRKLEEIPLGQLLPLSISFEAEGKYYSFPPEAVGIFVRYKQSVENAFDLTHKEAYLAGLQERLGKESLVCPLILGVNEKKLEEIIKALGDELRSTARDASFILYEETGGYHVEAETLGREVSLEKTLQETKARLKEQITAFPLIIDYAHPRITEAELRAHPPAHRLSAYTTYYGTHDSPNRIHNIKLIASWIDGTLLIPGDRFSVAAAIGEVTAERGFKEAFVIVGGVLVPLLGGGSCQIATTLYNTVALADLKILQRRNHSFYFNIYPLGRDAGVYPGQLDFRFENDSGYPVLIKAIATNRRLSFRIYGTPSGKKVEFSPAAVYLLSRSGNYYPSNIREAIRTDRPFKTFVIRTVYDKEGKEIKKETIASFYKLYGEKTNVPIARPEPR